MTSHTWEWAVVYGFESDVTVGEQVTGHVVTYESEAGARELAQFVPGAIVAKRRVHRGPWVAVTEFVEDDR